MRPVLTVEEMAAVDRAALAETTHDELVRRAGRRVAAHAKRLLDGCAGRRIVVVVGKGSNGADGRVAAGWLERWGARVTIVEAGSASVLPAADLVIDAAYGTGLTRSYEAPDPAGAPVLSVDIPSGIHGDTGEALGRPVHAVATVTFGARKPGLLLGAGPEHAGVVHVEPIGLDIPTPRAHLVDDSDVAWLPARPAATHKWRSAVLVVAGQPSVMGAPALTTAAAMRAGAGYVVLGVPGVDAAALPAGEHMGRSLPHRGWQEDLGDALDRVKAAALGPGLGRTAATVKGVRAVLDRFDGPVVLDADALHDLDLDALAARLGPTVLTPHEGEFTTLTGAAPGADRVGDVRALAARSGAVVLLKGPTTVVAHPDGRVLLAAAGTPALATAGTGDVLTGIVAAFCAAGAEPFQAAALAAHVHGRAAGLGRRVGLVAGDLPPLVADWLSA
jgi:hydroxyethylthiazole kinase-like uncharacterized protein yjeF